ncbi:MAG: HIT domain-containing protein [Verrucomicrobiota bacterium]
MEHLWAPWRNQYVEGKKVRSEHLFYEIGQSTEDEKHHVIYRSKSCYALLNKYPYNSGHLMVIPYQEISCLQELSESELLDLWATVNEMTQLLKDAYQPHGFNVGINMGLGSGAGFPQHLHVHVVPRWKDDANFLTTTAETRVHPHDLDVVYKTLKKALQKEI